MRFVIVCGLVTVASPAVARGDATPENVSAGPLIGLRLGGPAGGRRIVGVEGGIGLGPERLNLGWERRAGESFAYLEFDPWYLVGGSLGVGVDSDHDVHPVVGVWEALPLYGGDGGRHCEPPDLGWHTVVTIAVGYRYSGVHELYATLKGGAINGEFCLD